MALAYDGTPRMFLLNTGGTHRSELTPLGIAFGSGDASSKLARLFVEYIDGNPVGIVSADVTCADEIKTKSGTSLPKLFGKAVQWAPTDDGKYTLIGVD